MAHGGAHSHSHHDHHHHHRASDGKDGKGGGGGGGLVLRAALVAAAVFALPLPDALRMGGTGSGTGTGLGGFVLSKDTQRSLALSLGFFLIAVEASRSALVETRRKLGSVYNTFLYHQAAARTQGFGADKAAAADSKAANRITWVGAAVNVVLAAFKMVAGVVSGSAAMVADAGHSLSDLVSDFVTLATIRVSRLPPDLDHPYGHGRFEAIGALCIALLLTSSAFGFGAHAYKALLAAIHATAGGTAVTTAGAAVTTAGATGWWSSLGCGLQANGLALSAAALSILTKEALYHATAAVARATRSEVLMANAWHHRSDALSSVVALAGIGGSALGYPVLDPLAGLGVAGMLASTGVHVGWDAVRQLTDTVDEGARAAAAAAAAQVDGVVAVDPKAVRARRAGPSTLVDLTVQISPHLPASGANQVAAAVRWRIMADLPDVSEVLVSTTTPVQTTAATAPPATTATALSTAGAAGAAGGAAGAAGAATAAANAGLAAAASNPGLGPPADAAAAAAAGLSAAEGGKGGGGGGTTTSPSSAAAATSTSVDGGAGAAGAGGATSPPPPSPVLMAKACPLLATQARGADAIEADVRAALRPLLLLASSSQAHAASPPAPPSSSTTTTATTAAAASSASSTSSSSSSSSSPPSSSSSSSPPPPPLSLLAVHRVTVFYHDARGPAVGVLVDVQTAAAAAAAAKAAAAQAAAKAAKAAGAATEPVTAATTPPAATTAAAAVSLEALRVLGAQCQAAVETKVTDVSQVEVHLRLAAAAADGGANSALWTPPKKEAV